MSDTVVHNEYGEVIFLGRPATAVMDPSRAFGSQPVTPTQRADEFLQDNMRRLGLGDVRFSPAGETQMFDEGDAAPLIIHQSEREVAGARVVIYRQTALGLDVFDAHLGVQIDERTMDVAALQSAAHARIAIQNPEAKDDGLAGPVKPQKIADWLGFTLSGLSDGKRARQVVYRYEPGEREDEHLHEAAGCLRPGGADVPHLPPVADQRLTAGHHYICDEILFRAEYIAGETPVNWRMLVEPRSGVVLYLRALVACATGMVFDRDPQTQGGTHVTGASSNAELNRFRQKVTLAGLIPSTPQALKGEFVEIVDISEPAIAPPTVATSDCAFDYNVRTDNFSAVCAYYNCDRLFRTMQDYGFNIASYFDGTTFPVPIDHRGKGNQLNADAPGTPAGTGLGMMRYGLILPPNKVGIATSNRVVWHEFGHGLLWDNVASPNFGFAHSAGDSLAAILNDPGSLEPDRFDTFPWVQEGASLGRRHDRAIGDGWAWFGPNYNTQYNGEQILSTTLFRLYRAIGGDSALLPTQRRASEAAAFLIFKAIGLLTSTTAFPDVFVNALQTADITTPAFKGIPGGALHKVVRWAFEKQGLFQPDAAPGKGNIVDSEGNPPEVDVYLDDGRNGEYGFQAHYWSCPDMWVRHQADAGTAHQQPVSGQTNYMYVRVKNRGTRAAENVNVAAYHSAPGTGLAFPDDWTAMDTPILEAPGPLPPGESAIVGPFAFTPGELAHECLLTIASCEGDLGNDNTITDTIPGYRFVPFDNNIGQRNVHPVPPTRTWLMNWFGGHQLVIRNPFPEAKLAETHIDLPAFMRESGWRIQLSCASGGAFQLGPREARDITLQIEPGDELDPEVVEQAIAAGDGAIVLTTLLDGELSGGMTYPLSFEVDAEEAPDGPETSPTPEIRRTVLEAPSVAQVVYFMENRRVTRVVIESEEDDEARCPSR